MAEHQGRAAPAFETAVTTSDGAWHGPWRGPRQMLADQSYDDHASIHDDETARKLGFQGGTIEGPTHFSQFAPLGFALWGEDWLRAGCLSIHYRAPVYEGEKVRATLSEPGPDGLARARMEKEDGAEVLAGTASIAPFSAPTELDERLKSLPPLTDPVVLEGVKFGVRSERRPVKMGMDQHMGRLYPFSLAQKLERITEPSPWYAENSPFGRPIIPIEMISVLVNHVTDLAPAYTRGPVVGLFADQEIRLLDGPLFVDEPYEIDREVVALSGSRRTESLWMLTRIYHPGSDTVLATMLLNSAILKDSYADYAAEHEKLYAAAAGAGVTAR